MYQQKANLWIQKEHGFGWIAGGTYSKARIGYGAGESWTWELQWKGDSFVKNQWDLSERNANGIICYHDPGWWNRRSACRSNMERHIANKNEKTVKSNMFICSQMIGGKALQCLQSWRWQAWRLFKARCRSFGNHLWWDKLWKLFSWGDGHLFLGPAVAKSTIPHWCKSMRSRFKKHTVFHMWLAWWTTK